MALQNTNPTTTKAWEKLQQHFQSMQTTSMKEMFSEDASRAAKFHISRNHQFIA
jgi:glucose-6-phosphate isomerase